MKRVVRVNHKIWSELPLCWGFILEVLQLFGSLFWFLFVPWHSPSLEGITMRSLM